MANQQYLEKLRANVSSWNIWRKQQPKEPIDLSEASLSGADLRGANLSKVDLSKALELATDKVGGRVVDAKRGVHNGHSAWDVSLDRDGEPVRAGELTYKT